MVDFEVNLFFKTSDLFFDIRTGDKLLKSLEYQMMYMDSRRVALIEEVIANSIINVGNKERIVVPLKLLGFLEGI